ncbi:unnamed protein product [Citrullus colocynthis]|uniref:Uncharacterized protein n=1 Tax=Citrullus colocynthis TaxID=252529 RepID=A0ABP0Z1W1_9ROSI
MITFATKRKIAQTNLKLENSSVLEFFLDFGLVLAIFPTEELDQWRGYWISYALHRYRIFRVLVAGISLLTL